MNFLDTTIGRMALGAARDAAVKLAYYEWAYGWLAEEDCDVGLLGEFMTGLYVGGLEAKRREKAPCDLVAADGRTVEVKTSFGNEATSNGRGTRLRWNLRNEQASLQGRSPVADVWIFLHVSFPQDAGRFHDVFNPGQWRAWVVPGETVRRLNQGSNLSAARLAKAGFHPHPRAELPRQVGPSDRETSRLARENTAQSNALLRLAFFHWAYGDLTEGLNGGRFAEFQVLRVIGARPFGRRKARGPVDLVTRHGHAVEVKCSQALVRSASGGWRCKFLIPVHNGGRTVDHFVFCQPRAPGLDPVPLANWRFRWVPADVLAAHRFKVGSTALDALGYPPLTARQLAAAEAGAGRT